MVRNEYRSDNMRIIELAQNMQKMYILLGIAMVGIVVIHALI